MSVLGACLGQNIDLNIWTDDQAAEILVGKPFHNGAKVVGMISRAWVNDGMVYVEIMKEET